ncbi:MAG: PH domain-containing protein [Methanomassiliicoccaceae archaeon]|nr:PH domain-containing protein [Methanomassiliicoccaceae archaeon]
MTTIAISVVFFAIPVLYLALFFFRLKYILKNDRILIRRFFWTTEIAYSTIWSVEEVTDRTIFIVNVTPSVASSKQIWIWFTNASGNTDRENISPAKKQEFLSELRIRLPDPRIIKTEK